MEVFETGSEEYQKSIKANLIFDSVGFNELNSDKVENVRYFLFRDTKNRFGLCVGGKRKNQRHNLNLYASD